MAIPQSAIKAGCVNPVADNLSFEEASLAEPLACAINSQELLGLGLGDTVVILGAGALGCMHAELAKRRGASRVILADILAQRLELARMSAADVLIDSAKEDIETRIMEETEGKGASVVIVAAPSGKAQEQVLLLTAKQGRISFFGGLPKSDPLIALNANLVHYRELFIMGAYGSKPRHNRLALQMLADGRIHVSGLISQVIPLVRIKEGLDAVAQGKVLKVVVKPANEFPFLPA
jgi:L-iditol 2-dehydrogenase